MHRRGGVPHEDRPASGERTGRPDFRAASGGIGLFQGGATFSGFYARKILSRQTETIYTGIGTSVLQIDDAIQRATQQNVNALNPLFNQFAVTVRYSRPAVTSRDGRVRILTPPTR